MKNYNFKETRWERPADGARAASVAVQLKDEWAKDGELKRVDYLKTRNLKTRTIVPRNACSPTYRLHSVPIFRRLCM